MTENARATETIPAHLGLILDGNRRWAKERGLSAAEGHRRGARVVLDSLAWIEEVSIPFVTIWLLSTDNVARPRDELACLFDTIGDLAESIVESGYSTSILGSENGPAGEFVRALRARLTKAQQRHEQGGIDAGGSTVGPAPHLHVNLAVGYGGQQEIVDAAARLLREAAAQGFTLEDVARTLTPEALGAHMDTANQPAPDLLIRTSGERRLSGFMLWHTVHSELYFADVMWPDFTRADLDAALADYATRERRFGA